ncbi:10895_t:CDS:10 [Acaulospora colombiana]|uniref:10895_t:CDS:1 n=1 Tax=Acaulospora colombiana TaxID=27376 RepID=A0ACA9L340_9GLOM|nr:10895_t:CDS:10 [Acaulospora colombiana]
MKNEASDKTPPSTPGREKSPSVSATTTPPNNKDTSDPSTPKKRTVDSDLPASSNKVEDIVSMEVELHIFNPPTGDFVLRASNVTARIIEGGRFEYWLIVDEGPTRHIGQRIEPRMNPVFNSTHQCLIWCYFSDSGQIFSFLIRFRNKEDEYNFKRQYTICMYETLNETRAKEDDREYIMNAYQEDVDMPDADASDQEETEEEFATNISEIKKPSGGRFIPEKGMLHEEDSSIILLDPQDENSLFKMDLEYGKVVEEWKVHDIIPVSNIFPGSKYAQTTAEKTFIGMSHNSLYRIDPRLSGQKMIDSQLKQYVTKNNFTCGVTDEKGHIAVGSEKGDVKLFDTLGKNAKTNLPALGSGIKGIDVTADGKWIIATTARYLLLLNTEIKTDPNKPLGFEKSFPKNQKPIPRRLQLRPEHLSMMEEQIQHRRFGIGEDYSNQLRGTLEK